MIWAILICALLTRQQPRSNHRITEAAEGCKPSGFATPDGLWRVDLSLMGLREFSPLRIHCYVVVQKPLNPRAWQAVVLMRFHNPKHQ
jgi:hypothetical protein